MQSSNVIPESKRDVLDELRVLRELKTFFLEERDEGEKTEKYEIYNQCLQYHNAQLIYKGKEKKHVLYIDEEPVENVKVAAQKILKIINSLNAVLEQELRAARSVCANLSAEKIELQRELEERRRQEEPPESLRIKRDLMVAGGKVPGLEKEIAQLKKTSKAEKESSLVIQKRLMIANQKVPELETTIKGQEEQLKQKDEQLKQKDEKFNTLVNTRCVKYLIARGAIPRP